MDLEAYFEFVGADAIRIKGTRVGIETILRDYRSGAGPEEIALRYPTLSLEQIHATITYYLHRQAELTEYLTRCASEAEAAWQEQRQNPPHFVRELRERLEERRRLLQMAGGRTGLAPAA